MTEDDLRSKGWRVDGHWATSDEIGLRFPVDIAEQLQRSLDAAREEGRREALEEAARVCESMAGEVVGNGEYFEGKDAAYHGAADAIRALAEKEKPE